MPAYNKRFGVTARNVQRLIFSFQYGGYAKPPKRYVRLLHFVY